MPRRLLLLAALAAAAVSVAPASARDPLDEQRKLTKADNALASQIALQAGDLPSGFLPAAVQTKESALSCKRPDLSGFTITGESKRSYGDNKRLITVASLVQVFRSVRDARADFVASAIPGTKACVESMATGMKVTRSTFDRTNGIGERSVRYGVTATVATQNGRIPVHIDLLATQLGRVQATLITIAPLRSPTGQATLLKLMATRASHSPAA
jgi:hypothetical protein